MRKLVEIASIIAGCLIVIACCIGISRHMEEFRKACKAKGGEVVDVGDDYVCVREGSLLMK